MLIPRWLYPQDAFWDWFLVAPAFAIARQTVPPASGAGRCALCGRMTDHWITTERWATFTDWSAFRGPGAGLCPPCWAAKVYGHVGVQGGLAIHPDGRPGSGRSYSVLIVDAAQGITGFTPWSGAWWDIPPTRPLVALLVRGDNPSRQHWIFHAAVSASPDTVALLINGTMVWLPQDRLTLLHNWIHPLLEDPQAARQAVPQEAQALAALSWGPWFYEVFPVSPTLTFPIRQLLGNLVKRTVYEVGTLCPVSAS